MKKIILSLFVAGFFVAPTFAFATKGGWFLSRFAPKPEAAVSSFLRGVKQGDTDGALKGILSFRRDYFLKILESLKKDNVAFDIDYSVDTVSLEGNTARVVVKIQARDAKREPSEIIAGIIKEGARSWSSYFEYAKVTYEFAKGLGGALGVAPSPHVGIPQVNPEQWDFFLVKSGGWLRGYRWEIIDAPEFITSASGISLMNEIMRSTTYPQRDSASRNTAISQRDARRIADIKQIQLALELYFDRHAGQYPLTSVFLETEGYIPEFPVDPATNISYFYAAPQDRNISTYHLGAKLENAANPALKADKDFDSKAQNFRNGFDGSDPMYDLVP